MDDKPIFVEVCPLLTKHFTGIGRFAARTVEALARRAPLRLVNTIQGEQARNMSLSDVLPCGTELIVDDRNLPSADTDVQQWTRQLLRGRKQPHDSRFARQCSGVYTMLRPNERHFRRELCLLYDFTPMLMAGLHVPETREQFGRLCTEKAPNCDALVAISKSTKADASWMCRSPREEIVVGYPGPSLCVESHSCAKPVARRKDLILVVSTLEPRKNLPFLFKWFQETSSLPESAELWCVGPSGWLLNVSQAQINAQAKRRRISLLGVVSDRRLCELYKQATFSVYPSLYEGFGFPVLDSLRHGTPVLCSYNSSLQEFDGPGVYHFDPYDADTLEGACRELLANENKTLQRQDLENRFSWDLLAEEVIRLCA
jgi:glycosyltransferase involved in cell wall biosynthesis